MNRSSRIFQCLGSLIGLGLITGAGYLFWMTFLKGANPSISAAVVGAMATVLVGVVGSLYTQSQIKKREIEEAHRPRKVEIYKGFLDMIARMMADQNPNVSLEAPTPQELIDFLVEFKTDIMLWGSPKVIRAQLDFEKVSNSDGNVLVAVDALYRAIREDIGLSNRGLDKHQLVKMLLKDPNELDEMSASNKVMQWG